MVLAFKVGRFIVASKNVCFKSELTYLYEIRRLQKCHSQYYILIGYLNFINTFFLFSLAFPSCQLSFVHSQPHTLCHISLVFIANICGSQPKVRGFV